MEPRHRWFSKWVYCSPASLCLFIYLPASPCACLCVYILCMCVYMVSGCIYSRVCVYACVFKGMEIMTSSWDFRICPLSHSYPARPPCSLCLSHCVCVLSQIPSETHTCSLVICCGAAFSFRQLHTERRSKSCFISLSVTT